MPHLFACSDGSSVAVRAMGRPRCFCASQIQLFLVGAAASGRRRLTDLIGECTLYLHPKTEPQNVAQSLQRHREKTVRNTFEAMGLLPVVKPPQEVLELRRQLSPATRLWMVSTVILKLESDGTLHAVTRQEAYDRDCLHDHFTLHYTTLTDGRGRVWADVRHLTRFFTPERLMMRLLRLASKQFSTRPALIVHNMADGTLGLAASKYPLFETHYVREPLGLACQKELAATDLLTALSPHGP